MSNLNKIMYVSSILFGLTLMVFAIFKLSIFENIFLIIVLLVLLGIMIFFKSNFFFLTIIVFLSFATSFNMLHKPYGILILLLFLIAILLIKILKLDTNLNFLSKYEIFFLIWLIYSVVLTNWTHTFEKTWLNISALALGITLIWIMNRIIIHKNHFVLFYKIWSIAIFFTLLYALFEINFNIHFIGSGAYYYGINNIATVGFFNPNDYCFFLIMTLPINLFLLSDNKTVYKFLSIFNVIVSFYVISKNEARAMIALYIILILIHIIIKIKYKKLAVMLVSLLLVSICLIFSFFGKSFIKQMPDSDTSLETRIMLFNKGFKLFLNNPMGIGPGNIEYYLSKKTNMALHNFWLEILVQYGIFIFILLTIQYIYILYSLVKYIRISNKKEYVIPILIMTIIFIPASLESSSIFVFNITWLFFGVITCMANIIKNDKVFDETKQIT